MGSPEGEAGRFDNEGPVRRVRISRSFYLGKYEVTQGEWEAVMGENPSYFQGCGKRCPVENVAWVNAQEFIRKLNGRESGRGYRYRLPTEAEWEYAARGGTRGATPEGELRILGKNNAPELDGQGWYGGNSGVGYAGGWDCSDWSERQYEAERCGPHPVGGKRANPWGLHDMLGNVGEWVGGLAPAQAGVNRGGSWYNYARSVRSAFRGHEGPYYGSKSVGFRLARTE